MEEDVSDAADRLIDFPRAAGSAVDWPDQQALGRILKPIQAQGGSGTAGFPSALGRSWCEIRPDHNASVAAMLRRDIDTPEGRRVGSEPVPLSYYQDAIVNMQELGQSLRGGER